MLKRNVRPAAKSEYFNDKLCENKGNVAAMWEIRRQFLMLKPTFLLTNTTVKH